MAQVLKRQDEVLIDIYASRSGRSATRLRQLVNAETWLTAKEAVSEGLADRVLNATTSAPTDRFDPELSLRLLDL